MKLVTTIMLPFLAVVVANHRPELPQRRVRKATRPVMYHHLLPRHEKLHVLKFWIPSHHAPSSSDATNLRRGMYGSQRRRAGPTESSEQPQPQHEKNTAFTNVQWEEGSSLWFVHGDASLYSPEQVYHQRKKERQLLEKKESGSFWRRSHKHNNNNNNESSQRRRRRVQTTTTQETGVLLNDVVVQDQVEQQQPPPLEEDTTYALGEQDSTYTAGDTDLVYNDDREPKPLNGTLHVWNVSTQVEYGTENGGGGGEGENDDNNDTTNSTSSVVYTTTGGGSSNNDNDNATTTAASSFQPIRIRAILSEHGNGGEFLTERERNTLFHDILSPAILAWSAALRVDPVVGNLTVDRMQLYDGETCGPGRDSGYPTVQVPLVHLEEGIPDTDIVVYLTLGFVTEPNTLNPFSEDLIGPPNTNNSRNNNSTNASSNSASNNAFAANASTNDWSFLSNATYDDIGDDDDDANNQDDVQWPLCTGDYLASALYCSTDQYDRPTAALLHLCIDDSFFLERSLERDILTVMHELGHALGFNTQSMAHFRRPDGTPITSRDDNGDVVDSEVECTGPTSHHLVRRTEVLPLPSEEILQFRTVRGVRVAQVVTPSVRQVVRNHFDCQSLNGAELESGSVFDANNVSSSRGGGVSDQDAVASCIGDHWEKRLFRIDLMNPVVDEIPFSLRFSPVTLALFADSGWYQVDLSRATFSASWGRAAGCGFVNDTCVSDSGTIAESNKPFFCNEIVAASSRSTTTRETTTFIDEIHGCSPDLTRKAACSISQYGWDLPLEYQYFNSTFGANVGGSEPLLDFCPVYNGFANGLCKDSGNQLLLQVDQIEEFGTRNSRCVGGIVGQQRTALCLSIACVVEDRTLRVKVGRKWHLCKYSGQLISVSGDDAQEGKVICPDPIRTCPTFYCHRDCLGTGGTCNYTSGSCFCSTDTDENKTITENCFEVDKEERPDYLFYYDDDKSQKSVDESSISDYYVPTERELGGDKDGLEIWMIALIVVGGVVGLVLVLFLVRKAIKRYWIGDSSCTFWFGWPHDDDAVESVAVESSPGANKDKFVASMLVDMRVHADGRVDSLVESTTETEGSITETESSFAKEEEQSSLDQLDDILQESIEFTSYIDPNAQMDSRSEIPERKLRKRIIPDSL